MSERHVDLGYGTTRVRFSFDPGRFDVLETRAGTAAELDDAGLRARIDTPIGSDPLDARIRPGDRVVIVVPDATRASGSDRVAAAVLRKLRDLGAADERIAFLVGGGTHRAPTPDEVRRIVGREAAERIAVHFHDAFDEASHVGIGKTPRGTPVELNRRLTGADRVILIGAIGFHYFAGFSGGRKALLPACASDRSIQANHLLGFDTESLGKAPGIATAALDGNPVSEDMEDAARLFGPAYLVNSVLDDAGRITGLYAGDWFAAHRAGCADYLRDHSVRASGRRPVVIASAGGAPRDLNMIQSHKALEHARLLLEDGGDLVLLAECGDGLGRPDFLDWFRPGSAAGMAANLVKGYRIYGQTAWGIRWKSERYRVHLVSALPPDQVRTMGMIPHASLAAAAGACGSGRGWILPSGLGTLPILDAEPAPAAGPESVR